MMTTYQLVQKVEGGLISTTFSQDNVFHCMEVRGFDFEHWEDNKRLRPELYGKPVFHGLHGPMWGGTTQEGEPIVRYEDKGTYKTLST